MRRRVVLGLLAVAPTVVFAPRRIAALQAPPIRGQGGMRYQVPLPGIAFDGVASHPAISTSQVYQGGTLRIAVDHARAGTARVLGRSTPLDSAGDGVEAFLGFGVDDPVGPTRVDLDYTTIYGEQQQDSFGIRVLKTQWTVDYIDIPPTPPPDPRAPPPPPPPPDETNLLPVVYAGRTPRKWDGAWQLPLPEPISVTGYFGEQRSFNGGPVQGHHGGTDLGAAAGTPIFATNAGTVALAGLYLTRGNMTVIDHGGGVFSCYGHQSELLVAPGDTVTKGQTIGKVGSTGLSTGPHLHWEMSVAGILVDGLRWTDGTQGF